LSRFDGELTAVGEASLDMIELLVALSGRPSADQERQSAIACFLSASEGWRDAKEALDGTFASLTRAPWLRDGKE
jgi:hypothetical protein